MNSYFNDEKEKTLKLIETIIEQEINYLFTNDKDYMNNYTEFIPKYQKVVYHHLHSKINQIRKIKNEDSNKEISNSISHHKR